MTILDSWKRSVETFPDNPAVFFDGKSYSYKEIDNISDNIAAHLQKAYGVVTETIVGVMINRSPLMAIYPLAIMKCGAAYMPLDPHFPEERLSFMCDDAGVKLILSDEGLVDEVMPSFKGNIFYKDSIERLPQAVPSVPEDFCGSSLLVVLYTSGSTGRPKGVLLEHEGLVNWCNDYVEMTSMDSSDRSLAYANFGFDAHMLDLYPTFLAGACVYILDNDTRLDLVAMDEYINRNAITIAFMTTQIASQMASLFELPTIKSLATGGEKLPPMTASSKYKFFNIYGPTETTIAATACHVVGYTDGKNIGKALPGYSLMVVDKDLKPVVKGEEGELVIMGIGVGRGYLNRPDVTAEKFITIDGQRAYRTGDSVKEAEDGSIEFCGRMDGQVKLRGLRIELGEVEAAMLLHPAVSLAVAAVKEVAGTGHLYGYYQLKDGMEASAEDIRNIMAQSVTDFMLPEEFMLLETVPYTPNGKVDKRALPLPEISVAASQEDGILDEREPNELEASVMKIVGELVGKDSVSLLSPLKLCGLTSILSMRLAVQIHKLYGLKLNSKDILGNSIESLSAKIEENEAKGVKEDSIQKSDITSCPLSFSQQGVYMDCVLNPEDLTYNLPMMVTFPSSVDAVSLKNATLSVMMAHPVHNIRFKETAEGTIQEINSDVVIDIPVRNIAADKIDTEIKAFIRPFDFSTGPMWRAEVWIVDNACRLMLDAHHLVSDGSSYNLLLTEIADVLNGKEISPEQYTFFDFVTDQQKFLKSPEFAEHKKFLSEQLSEFESVSELTADIKSPSKSALAKEIAIPLGANENLSIEGATRAQFWLAAVGYTIARYTNSKDAYMATVSSGRQNLDIADTAGMFVNTLPVFVHIKDQTVREFVLQTADMMMAAIDHENYPFAAVVADHGYNASVSYGYQLGLISDYKVKGEDVSVQLFEHGKAKFKMSITIAMFEGKPSVVINYDTSLYSERLMKQVAESILATAQNFCSSPDTKVKSISVMSDSQKAVVDSFRSVVSEGKYNEADTFHEGIERWAVTSPDTEAVIASDRTLTYQQLNAEANQLARTLAAHGVCQRDRIVLLLPRRSYYITSFLAVMKCGAAFIPMDPEYPADRISYILDDSQGRYVITTNDKVNDYPGRAIDIEQLLEESKAYDCSNLGLDVDTHDLAYLIYTSGSTGRPKGVMLEHYNVVNYYVNHPEHVLIKALTEGVSRMLCQTTVSFDLSLSEYAMALYFGKTAVFANEEELMNPAMMTSMCRRNKVETISGTPSRLEANLEMDDYRLLVAEQIKAVLVGGEKVSQTLIDKLDSMNVIICNGYGPTETTQGSSASILNGASFVHVGKPFPNYTYQILDSDLNELPVGVMGELCIGGKTLARGYNNLPEKTAEVFIEWNGKRIYRTGDYARWTPEGDTIILGRTDNQVKLNGLRIELGEIETVMGRQNGIRQCVVVIKKIGAQDKLVGYYTVDHDFEIPDNYDEVLKAGMGENLTPYMIPSIFVHMDELPITPAGKTDVKRLPTPEMAMNEYVAPTDEVEVFFCNLFTEILNLSRVGATDNFFEIGGTSLVAMRVIGAAVKAGYNIVYKNIFDNPTPRQLSSFLREGDGQAEGAQASSEITGYDYTQLNDILAANNLDSFRNGKMYETMGSVLLTGATGYLGIHVLHELILRNDVPHIYCMVRSNRRQSASSRLRTLLFYYFADAYEELFDDRIVIVEGDVTNYEAFESIDGQVDVVINCAANVKHFSVGTDIEDINIGGNHNCIEFCLARGARYIQTSTCSIGGNNVGHGDVKPHYLLENELYFGQDLSNKYCSSKFLAEREVLDSVRNRGLRGKVMRLGNLSARSTDGEFQVNYRSNSFMGSLKAFQILGCVPYSMDGGFAEFSPINEVAEAIIRLSLTPDAMTVFNVTNNHQPIFGDVIECMNNVGIKIERVEEEDYSEKLAIAMADAQKAEILQSLMAYQETEGEEKTVSNLWSCEHTTQVLLRLGFRWSFTTWDYMEDFLRAIQGLGFFDEDYQR